MNDVNDNTNGLAWQKVANLISRVGEVWLSLLRKSRHTYSPVSEEEVAMP
jgi:hypothetical protein